MDIKVEGSNPSPIRSPEEMAQYRENIWATQVFSDIAEKFREALPEKETLGGRILNTVRKTSNLVDSLISIPEAISRDLENGNFPMQETLDTVRKGALSAVFGGGAGVLVAGIIGGPLGVGAGLLVGEFGSRITGAIYDRLSIKK